MSAPEDFDTPERAASELLTDDGRIDVSAVTQLSNTVVPQSDCDEFRARLADDGDSHAVEDALGYANETVRRHARGDCIHDGGHPPVAYVDGAWRVAGGDAE